MPQTPRPYGRFDTQVEFEAAMLTGTSPDYFDDLLEGLGPNTDPDWREMVEAEPERRGYSAAEIAGLVADEMKRLANLHRR